MNQLKMVKREVIKLLDEYKCLEIVDDNIKGFRRPRIRKELFPLDWQKFISNTSLMKIRLTQTISFGLKWEDWYKESWQLQDGYGKMEPLPPHNYDWLGFKNSSDESIKKMVVVAEKVWRCFCDMYGLEHLWPWETYFEFSCEREAADGLDKEEDYIFYGVKVYHMEEVYEKIFGVLNRMKEKDGYWSFKVEDMHGELVWSLELRWDEWTEGFKNLFERR